MNEIFKTAFSQWNTDHEIGTKSIEQYPMLFGISHQLNGDYIFKYLINGSKNRPDVDEFLARLIQLKDDFDFSEEDFEKQKKQDQINNLFRTHDFHNHYDFSSSTSMNFNRNSSLYSRFLNTDNNQFSLYNRTTLSNTFRQLNINPNDGDDEDDDDEQTPTVDYPPLRYPK
jgi:hypothetical protein